MIEVCLPLALQMHLALTAEFRACNLSFLRPVCHSSRLPVSPQERTIDSPRDRPSEKISKVNVSICYEV